MLYREPKLLKVPLFRWPAKRENVSVLYREPKLLKAVENALSDALALFVSVLYREPKLLKGGSDGLGDGRLSRFSALP